MSCIRQRVYYFSFGGRRYKKVEQLFDITSTTCWCTICTQPAYIAPPATNVTTIDLTTENDEQHTPPNDTIDLTAENDEQHTPPNDNQRRTPDSDEQETPSNDTDQRKPSDEEDDLSSESSYSW